MTAFLVSIVGIFGFFNKVAYLLLIAVNLLFFNIQSSDINNMEIIYQICLKEPSCQYYNFTAKVVYFIAILAIPFTITMVDTYVMTKNFLMLFLVFIDLALISYYHINETFERMSFNVQ